MIKRHKKLISTIAAGCIIGLSNCQANNDSNSKEQGAILASKVAQSINDIRVNDKIWEDTNSNLVTLYPQTTIRVNDRTANKLNAKRFAKNIQVKALTDGKKIALKVIWDDETKSIQTGTKTDEYADGFAIQIPVNFHNLNKLPYIGMGSPDRPVILYLRKSVEEHFEPNGFGEVKTQVNERNTNAFDSELGNGLEKFRIDAKVAAYETYERVFIAEGFRSTTQIRDNLAKFRTSMKYNENKKRWEAMLVRPLNDSYTKLYTDSFPIALAVWDGEKLNRDGLKKISSWTVVKIKDSKGSKKIEELIGTVNRPLPKADTKRGEKLAKTNCASCHWFAEVKDAPRYMAPNLQNIGGYSTTEYLKESITKPNEVVVSGYNRNAHPNYKWYFEDGQGGRISAMPAFDYLKSKDIDDIVAYLKTLKAEVK